jgi:hypothetical protein
MTEYVVRFLVGGIVVSAFATLGDILRPKSFAGLCGAAPSVALATDQVVQSRQVIHPTMPRRRELQRLSLGVLTKGLFRRGAKGRDRKRSGLYAGIFEFWEMPRATIRR